MAVHGSAVDAQSAALQGEIEEDARRGIGARHVGGIELRGVTVAGGAAVEGVADGIQNGGFTGAGGAVEQEDAGSIQITEVNGLPVGVCHEGFKFEAVQDHAWSF